MDRNLLRDAWLAIGRRAPSATRTLHALGRPLRRVRLHPVVDSVQSRVFSGKGLRFKPGCRVPVGFTMTRVVPQLRTVSGLRVKSQQTVVPLIFEVDRPAFPGSRRDTGLRSTGMAADAATLADASGRVGSVHSLRPGDPGAAGLGSLPRRLRSPTGVRMPPGVCGDGQREVTPDQCPGPRPERRSAV